MSRLRLVLFCCLYGIGLTAHAQVPVPDFSASRVSGCAALGVTFTDKSTGSPSHWTWDFGNGSISSQQNPSVTYTSAGVYTVTLIVQNSNGSNSIRKTNYITVYASPSANFGENLTLACAPAHIQFNDLSTAGAGGSIVSWTWAFGDGTTSNEQNPAHIYTNIGYNSVSLNITNSGGCGASYFVGNLIRVVQGVQPNFTYAQTTQSCAAPYQLSFNNQTSGPGTMTYNWSFGNGLTSTVTSPSTIYPAGGAYTVTLIAQSSLGCGDTIQQAVSFGSNQAQIGAPAQACTNVPLTLTNTSTPAPLSSTWDFGDGTGSTDLNPIKTYSAPNAYNVRLVNTYATCTDTSTTTIQVVNNPAPAFTADVTAGCTAPLTVNFTDQTSPAPTNWSWDFGDGTTSNLQSPSHTYSSLGSFDVKLTVTAAGGCDSTITKTKFINIAAPSLTFVGQANGCVNTPIPISPKNTISVSAPDGVSSYLWTATGATPSSSTVAAPSFSYAVQGSYALVLTVTTKGGCTVSQTFPNAVLVGTPTSAIINAPTASCANDSVAFSSPSTPADKFSWYFGDGSSLFGNPVKHLFKQIGTYSDTLYVRNSGCVTRATKSVTINGPIAGFSVSTPNCNNRLMVMFTDTSAEPVAAGPYTYLWNFGDPASTTSTIQDPSFTYLTTGTYNVTLTVSNALCSSTITVPITINPSVASMLPVTPPICRNTNFLVTSNTNSPQLVASYSWQIDGGAAVVGGSTYTANIPNTGPHTLALTIMDIYGCTNTATQNITVTGPVAKFTSPTTAGGCVNSALQFTDNSVPYAGNPITNWSWNYGDGPASPSAGPGPLFPHTYADTGSYTVQLVITDNIGCVDTFTAPAPILITSPQAKFSVADTLYCPNVPLPFLDSSSGHGLTYNWNFGDGNTATTAGAAAHSYAGNGQYYSVTLTVTDQVGCSNSLSRPNYIHIQHPIAAFDIADTTTICTPLQTNFTSQGQYYDSLYWKFGDGSTSTLPVTSHFYNSTGTFNAKLILKGAGGCLDSATRRVFVLDGHTATTFSYSPTKACDSVLTIFKIIPPAFSFFYTNYGDGVVDSSENTAPSHLYKNPGTYGPGLTLRDSTGCLVGIPARSGNITVLGAVPFFSASSHAFCDSAIVTLADYTITNDAITSETWNFGDGTPNVTRTTPPISPFDTTHLFAVPGKIPVTLKVNTTSNCAENYTDTIRVYQTPHAQISTTGSLCTGLIQFNGTLVPPDADTIIWAWNFGNGQTSALQNPAVTAAPGTYTVSLQTSVSFGCSDTTSSVVTIDSLPTIKGPKEISTPVGIPVIIPFTYSSNVTTYVWSPPTNLDCATCPNPTATLTNSQLYAVTVTDVNGCVASDSILVKTICNGQNYFFPNTFSPNNDGVNDAFYPRGNNVFNIQSLRIFNRWGQMVFERKNFPANSASDGWDGTFNGRPAPSDAYIYISEVLCNNSQVVVLKGDITLVR